MCPERGCSMEAASHQVLSIRVLVFNHFTSSRRLDVGDTGNSPIPHAKAPSSTPPKGKPGASVVQNRSPRAALWILALVAVPLVVYILWRSLGTHSTAVGPSNDVVHRDKSRDVRSDSNRSGGVATGNDDAATSNRLSNRFRSRNRNRCRQRIRLTNTGWRQELKVQAKPRRPTSPW